MTADDTLSVGIDVVSIDRISESLTDGVVDRVFTDEEASYCRSQVDSPQHFAARWAAKEAAIKALPDDATVAPEEIEVVGGGCQPTLMLSGAAAKMQRSFAPNSSTSVSLTHDRSEGIAAAVVALATDSQIARACASETDLAGSIGTAGRD